MQLGINNSLPITTAFKLNGGIFFTNGYNQTVASLSVTDNATLSFSNSNTNTFTSNSISSFSTGKILTINGWEGTYAAPGSTGNFGKFILSGTSLTSSLLSQIKFYNTSNATIHNALQLGSYEIVAGN